MDDAPIKEFEYANTYENIKLLLFESEIDHDMEVTSTKYKLWCRDGKRHEIKIYCDGEGLDKALPKP